MQHAVDSMSSVNISAHHGQHPSAMVLDTISHSSNSSPKSQKASIEPNVSQVSESTLASTAAHELTPPSSVASIHEQQDVDQQLTEEIREGEMAAPPTVSGKKRTSSGEVKDNMKGASISEPLKQSAHARTTSQASSASMGELSQQLRTKLTYAMLKVQNGWQKHSLDEIESIASQSPRSNFSGFAQREYQSMVSPRAAIAAGSRHNSDTSGSSDPSPRQRPRPISMSAAEPLPSSSRKALAPPAPIVPGNRRRPTPNVHLQINSTLKPPPKPIRPTTNQRTPSQNAAMEADAVETLLFMSASPNNSGHFPSHLSTYSPTSQTFSAQASPLKSHFSHRDRQSLNAVVTYSPQSSYSYRRARYEDKAALIDRLLHDLDDEESEELDRALKIMEQHRAAKLSA